MQSHIAQGKNKTNNHAFCSQHIGDLFSAVYAEDKPIVCVCCVCVCRPSPFTLSLEHTWRFFATTSVYYVVHPCITTDRLPITWEANWCKVLSTQKFYLRWLKEMVITTKKVHTQFSKVVIITDYLNIIPGNLLKHQIINY